MQQHSSSYDVVSSQEIYELSPRLRQNQYDYAVVLSYSRSHDENRKLLHNLRLFVPRVIYVSTVAVKAADLGYFYQYPRVKRLAERYLKDSNLYERVRILRLGVVEGTFGSQKVAGRYYYTTLDQLAEAICPPQTWPARMDIVPLYTSQEAPAGSAVEAAVFRFYRSLLLQHPAMGILLRPVDIVLRQFGWAWYGYNCVINYARRWR